MPLIVKYPRAAFAGARIGSLVRGIDIAPTIADVLDIGIPPSFEGSSLTAAITGADRGVRWSLSETGQETPSFAVRTDRWKLYDGRLFDLLADPGETEDASDRYPTVRLAMETAMARLLRLPPLVKPRPWSPEKMS